MRSDSRPSMRLSALGQTMPFSPASPVDALRQKRKFPPRQHNVVFTPKPDIRRPGSLTCGRCPVAKAANPCLPRMIALEAAEWFEGGALGHREPDRRLCSFLGYRPRNFCSPLSQNSTVCFAAVPTRAAVSSSRKYRSLPGESSPRAMCTTYTFGKVRTR
jgi:hypothetical protein